MATNMTGTITENKSLWKGNQVRKIEGLVILLTYWKILIFMHNARNQCGHYLSIVPHVENLGLGFDMEGSNRDEGLWMQM